MHELPHTEIAKSVTVCRIASFKGTVSWEIVTLCYSCHNQRGCVCNVVPWDNQETLKIMVNVSNIFCSSRKIHSFWKLQLNTYTTVCKEGIVKKSVADTWVYIKWWCRKVIFSSFSSFFHELSPPRTLSNRLTWFLQII